MPPRRRRELCSALQAELTARADAELAVDVAQVILDGLLADVHLLRDLLVRHALRTSATTSCSRSVKSSGDRSVAVRIPHDARSSATACRYGSALTPANISCAARR